jgi:hypothetical protein
VKNLLTLSIGILLVTLSIWSIFNEYIFRRSAVAVEARAAGFAGDGRKNYHQEVIFTCPFTKIERCITRVVESEGPKARVLDTTIKVYVSPESPHGYRLESPMYPLGNLGIAACGFGLIATYFR